MKEISKGPTPVIKQYLSIKSRHQDMLLFFRMGDFYELFFEDAQIAAKALDIVLTKRGQYKDEPIPMCGVPVHNYATYTDRLIKQGYNIAVCEQMESPIEAKKRGVKSIVERDVVRILTPGTLTEDHLLDPCFGNYLLVIAQDVSQDSANPHRFCLLRYDISTGKNYFCHLNDIKQVTDYIHHLSPAEIITQPLKDPYFLANDDITLTPKTQEITHIPSDDHQNHLSSIEIKALSILLSFLDRTQKGAKILLRPFDYDYPLHYLCIDPSSLKNLELTQSITGGRANTLLSIMDNMTTKGGSRLLSERILRPLTDKEKITERYNAIEFFIQNPCLAKSIRDVFKKLPDIERILGRLQMGRSSPADLGNIRTALTLIYQLLTDLNINNFNMPPLLANAFKGLCYEFRAYDKLCHALREDPPITLKMGDFIKSGYDALLDEYRNLQSNTQGFILALEGRYQKLTDITSLKIKHNNIIGYHIDVSAIHADKILNKSFDDIRFIHKQTLANNIRFTSDELLSLEKNIFEAAQNFNKREAEIFAELCDLIIEDIFHLANFADGFAQIDLYASHACLVVDYDYVRPVLQNKKSLSITALRHPVIEVILQKKSSQFIPNDCHFLKDTSAKTTEIWLLSGPNMGGKSTFLRQNALAIIMAQAGFYVAATNYKAGIFDKVFSRVGASDNLSKGQSTFMIEMSEMANILNNATAQSFVILDEIGRGTSTYDGLSIAYACVKYLTTDINCMGLFATHYHELTQLTRHSKSVGHLQVTISEYKKEIIFLHKIMSGAAEKSYGINVAELAGMPKIVLNIARQFLLEFDHKKMTKSGAKSSAVPETDRPLLQNIPPQDQTDPIRELITNIDINKLSPIEAFGILDKIKSLL